MTINAHTKIAFLLKQNPDALEVMANVNPKFERLRNPLLRKLLAGRTTIQDAARIGKCEVEEIAEALKPLGFEFTEEDGLESRASASLPDFIKNLDETPQKIVDVRQDLAEGKDPLKKIMSVVKSLPHDHVLQLINTFEPTPLINLLKKKGYESYVKEISSEEIHTFFKLKAKETADTKELTEDVPEAVTEKDFSDKLNEFGEHVQSVNVSNMEMPMPMVTILEALESLPEGYVLSVQHKRIPVFLFNELKERDFQYLLYLAGENDVKLLIFHKQ